MGRISRTHFPSWFVAVLMKAKIASRDVKNYSRRNQRPVQRGSEVYQRKKERSKPLMVS
jgi:hypothetical protein